MGRKINFEDRGQDFLWWVIDENYEVTDCGPFQASVWVGSQIERETLAVGEQPCFETNTGQYLQLKYKVESIEDCE